MAKIRGDIVGKEICEALGMSHENVHSIILDFTAGAVATLTIERYLDTAEIKPVKIILEQYTLELKNGD